MVLLLGGQLTMIRIRARVPHSSEGQIRRGGQKDQVIHPNTACDTTTYVHRYIEKRKDIHARNVYTNTLKVWPASLARSIETLSPHDSPGIELALFISSKDYKIHWTSISYIHTYT